MIQEIERTKSPAEVPVPEGTWIQITFTVTPDRYRALQDRAEKEGLTVPGFVRQSVMDALKGIQAEESLALAGKARCVS